MDNSPAERFVVFAPSGMAYLPPVPIEEARQVIAERATYSGQPGWSIVPLWLAVDATGTQIRNFKWGH